MPAAPDSDRIAKEVGDAIRARRLELALTQVEVAERAGVDPDYFGRIERGEKNVSVARLVHVAAALSTGAAQLLAGVK